MEGLQQPYWVLQSLLSEGKCLFPPKLNLTGHWWSAQPEQLPALSQPYITSNMFWRSTWDWAKVSPILMSQDLFSIHWLTADPFMIHNYWLLFCNWGRNQIFALSSDLTSCPLGPTELTLGVQQTDTMPQGKEHSEFQVGSLVSPDISLFSS